MTKKKKIIAALIISLLIAAVVFFVLKSKKSDFLTLYGNIEIRQTDLAFRVKGRLIKLYAEEGDSVKEGDLLAEIDPDTYKAAFNQSKADIVEKRAIKEQKAAIYAFNKPLCADFTISKEECSNLKYEYETAKGAYENAVAQLEKSIINLDDTKLYAPYDGIITTRVREKGTIVNTEDIVYSIQMMDPIWVRAYIEEPALGKIRLGQKALCYSDSDPKKGYKAHIGFISPVAEFTPKTVETTTLRTDLVYRLRIIIDDKDPFLRQGMPMTVRILDDDIEHSS